MTNKEAIKELKQGSALYELWENENECNLHG